MKNRLITALLAILVVLGGATVRAIDMIPQPDYSFLWNCFNDVKVIGNYALVSSDFGLAVMELDPETGVFSEVSEYLLENQPTELSVAGDIATVSTTAGVLYFFDLSNLPDLSLTGQADLAENVHDALLMGDNLYLACGFQGLRRFVIDPGSGIQFVDSSLAPIHCIQVEAVGPYLIVLDDYNGLLRYRPSEYGIARVDARINIPRRVQQFFGSGDTLVLALVDSEQAYRARFGDSPGILDSVNLGIVPEAVFQIDEFVVAVNTYRRTMAMTSTWSGQKINVDLSSNLEYYPDGDTYRLQGERYLMLVSGRYGLASFNLDRLQFDREPRQTYMHPGPVKALAFASDRFLTGGTYSPLEAYTLSAPLHPELDTALLTHYDVDAIAGSGDLAFVHMNGSNRLHSFRITADSVCAVSSVVTRTDPHPGIKYFDFVRSDTLGIVLVVGASTVDLIGVSPSGVLRLAPTVNVFEPIYDAIVLDSFLFVSTASRQILGYLIFSSLSTVFWSATASAGTFDHMTFSGPRHAPDGTWHEGIALAFDGNQMYQVYVNDKGFPWTTSLGSLPVEVTSTACTPDALYGIGPQGTVVIDIRDNVPNVLAYGGYGGSLIAVQDSVMAVSDGSGVHLYVYRNEAFLPVNDSPPIATESLLEPNYPNPFNPRTRIDFLMPAAGRVEIAVFDVLGRKVATLIESELAAGPHSVEWLGTDHSGNRVASGIYFYRMTTPRTSESRKMVLLK